MRRNAVSKILYWIVGLLTGCILVLKSARVCPSIAQTDSEQEIIRSTVEHLRTVIYGPAVNQSAVLLNESLENSNTIPPLTKEWLGCFEIETLYSEIKFNEEKRFRKENKDGNRDVFFTKIRNQTGQLIRVVVKHASIYNFSSESEQYRYQCAQREVDNLRKLQLLNWTGIPQMLGACVKKHDITYVVSEVIGKPLCLGNGTGMDCALSSNLKKFFRNSQNREYLSILWLSKVTCFFKQFEEHQVFMEDFSGINFYYNPQTLDFYVVDADSMIFYNGIRINSRSSCRENKDCSRPTGNLWRYNALNHKVYYVCVEGGGYCYENKCWGYDAALHTCGVAQWLINPVRNIIPPRAYADYTRILNCMLEPFPERRCSISNCCETAKTILRNLKAPSG